MTENNAKICENTDGENRQVEQIVIPRISHFIDMFGNRHEVNEAGCLIDHRGIIIFYLDNLCQGEKTKRLLEPKFAV